jgi:glycosyltransferase involved in cell wall biosynthesis
VKIHYYGHVGQGTGYAVAAQETCRAIADHVPNAMLRIFPLGNPSHLAEGDPLRGMLRPNGTGPQDGAPDIVIVHTLPMDCQRVIETLPPKQALCVAYTTWEAFTSPLGVANFKSFDQVWVPSGITQATLRNTGIVSEIVPHAFDDEAPFQVDTGSTRKPDETYRFYYIGAWTSRKNPAGVIRAYIHAFRPDDPVELVLQCAGASADSLMAAVAQCGLSQHEIPRINFSNQRRADDEIDALHRRCDCFVTASRGESWNLPAFEAMLHGRHIITPGNLGSNEFLLGTSTDFVNWELQPAVIDVEASGMVGGATIFKGLAAQGLSCKHVWPDPNLLHMAAKMAQAVRNNTRSLRVSYNPSERYGYAAIGARIHSLLQQGL